MASSSFYESKDALEQYLFFHYGAPKEYLPWPGPKHALGYPSVAVKRLLDIKRLPKNVRALDLGCAVGRTSFELSRVCGEVIGVDLSASFIRAANRMKRDGAIEFSYREEGDRRLKTKLSLPSGIQPERVQFVVADAMNIPPKLGMFDVAVLLNLIDRVPDPAQCLRALTTRLRPGSQLIISSPYTWLEEYTPKRKWLGATMQMTTFVALRKLLAPRFHLIKRVQIPFFIREHARKFQWSMADGSCWERKG